MKKSILYSFLLLLTACQTYPWRQKMRRDEAYHKSITCNLTKTYSVEQRRQMFPFNKAKKIVAIAYKNFGYHNPVQITVYDTIIAPDNTKLPVANIGWKETDGCDLDNVLRQWQDPTNKFCATEIIELKQNQIDSLSNILFNFKLNTTPYSSAVAGCYSPRNAVLFLDENDNMLAWLEVCFQCHRIKTSFWEFEDNFFDSNCSERKVVLRSFFQNIGIKYGLETQH